MRRTAPVKLPVVRLTQAGFDSFSEKIKALEAARQDILVRLQAAREMGDLSENGAYKAARFELSDTDRTLRRLRYLVRFAQIVTPEKGNVVDFGSQVTLKIGDKTVTYLLVSLHESNPKEGKLSVESPLGHALMGKKAGDTVLLDTQLGTQTYRIKKVA